MEVHHEVSMTFSKLKCRTNAFITLKRIDMASILPWRLQSKSTKLVRNILMLSLAEKSEPPGTHFDITVIVNRLAA